MVVPSIWQEIKLYSRHSLKERLGQSHLEMEANQWSEALELWTFQGCQFLKMYGMLMGWRLTYSASARFVTMDWMISSPSMNVRYFMEEVTACVLVLGSWQLLWYNTKYKQQVFQCKDQSSRLMASTVGTCKSQAIREDFQVWCNYWFAQVWKDRRVHMWTMSNG